MKLNYNPHTKNADFGDQTMSAVLLNMLDVENYSIEKEGDTITHNATIKNGGSFTISIDTKTNKAGFKSHNVLTSFLNDEKNENHVIVEIRKNPENQT